MTALAPFSAEWAEALRQTINSDAEYHAAGAGWKWPIALVMNAAPSLGFPAAVAVELTLAGGMCSAARIIDALTVTAPFVLRADYGVWKELARGTIDALHALTSRRIALTGSLPKLLFHTKAVRALVSCARRVPTKFPDDA
jgi:putative sterol carrier protein